MTFLSQREKILIFGHYVNRRKEIIGKAKDEVPLQIPKIAILYVKLSKAEIKAIMMWGNTFEDDENVLCGLVQIGRDRDYEPDEEDWGWESDSSINAPIPLISVDIKAMIIHAVGHVEVTQVYENKEDQPIEAIFYFPVDPNGAVTQFQAELEGRVIKGTVKPRDEAKNEYKTAVKNKTSAFLGEETDTDIFKVRVGFLNPGTQAKVIISYVTEVKNEPDSDAIRFCIPTTIAPRYVSPTDDESSNKAKDMKKMKFSPVSPAPLSLKVAAILQGTMKHIESSTHTVKIGKPEPIPGKVGWQKTMVELTGDMTDMNQDFVLHIIPEDVHQPRMYSETMGDGSKAVMVHLLPSFQLDEQKTELIFVLDRSGSMVGPSIMLAKKALLLFLHSMPADCYFNVVGFGSSHSFLFPRSSVKYDDESLPRAIAHANSLEANLGGTEILQPLKKIYEKPGIPGYLRQIFLLTDGDVCNTDGVIGIAHANSHKARVFAIGIGNGASHHLIEGVAKAGGGTCAFVTYNESIDGKVLNQLKNAVQPSLTDVELEWEGLQENATGAQAVTLKANLQSPNMIPPVYDGSQMLVFGMFNSQLPTAVNIKAQSPDGPLTLRIEHSTVNDVGPLGMLHRLAAVKLVREMELEVAALRYKKSKVFDRKEKLKKDITELACKNGITSKYTSFVAVDVNDGRPSPDNWVMETREVPSQVPKGYGGSSGSGRLRGCAARCGAKRMRSAGTSRYRSSGARVKKGCSRSGTSSRPMKQKSRCSSSRKRKSNNKSNQVKKSSPRKTNRSSTCSSRKKLSAKRTKCSTISAKSSRTTPKATSSSDLSQSSPLMQLISLQSFEGSYNLDNKLAKIVGKSLDSLKKGATKQKLDKKVFATLLAICMFIDNMSGDKALWELVVKKSRKWLKNSIPSGKMDDIMQGVATFI